MNIAIITARGGSKRLHKKNIKLLHGKPMIEWTIIAAIKSKIFNEIHVNTDCHEIAKISIQAGASVPFMRPNHLASDFSSSRDVILNHYKFLEKNYRELPNTICILQPTSPNRDYKDIISAYDVLKKMNANSVVSIAKLDHPIEICNRLADNGSMEEFIDQSKIKRSQDNSNIYRINGAIYILDDSLNGDLNNLYNSRTFPYLMNSYSSIDIDTYNDFLMAEYFMRSDK